MYSLGVLLVPQTVRLTLGPTLGQPPSHFCSLTESLRANWAFLIGPQPFLRRRGDFSISSQNCKTTTICIVHSSPGWRARPGLEGRACVSSS